MNTMNLFIKENIQGEGSKPDEVDYPCPKTNAQNPATGKKEMNSKMKSMKWITSLTPKKNLHTATSNTGNRLHFTPHLPTVNKIAVIDLSNTSNSSYAHTQEENKRRCVD